MEKINNAGDSGSPCLTLLQISKGLERKLLFIYRQLAFLQSNFTLEMVARSNPYFI